MLLDDLYQVIEKLRERITIHGDQLRKSEALTRNVLVDPLLRTLGWDTENPSLVIPEFKVTKVNGGDGFADYALLRDGRPAIVIETKKLGDSLVEAANQCFDYCSKDGILYFAVTDGSKWEVYETNRPVAFAEKKIVSFDIKDSPGNSCLDALALWRRSVQSGLVRKAQTPLLDPQSEPPFTVNQSEPVAEPAATTPTATTATVREGNWQPLTQFKAMKGNKPPPQIRFPDGSTAEIRHWWNIPAEVVRWLAYQGSLDETCVPVQRGSRYILSCSPVHPTGKRFTATRQIELHYLEINYNGLSHLTNTNIIIEKAGKGVTPEQFSVSLPE